LNSKVINDFYENYDSENGSNTFIIIDLIKNKKFWNRIKFIELFTSHSGITTSELIIIINDHLPGIFEMKKYNEQEVEKVT